MPILALKAQLESSRTRNVRTVCSFHSALKAREKIFRTSSAEMPFLICSRRFIFLAVIFVFGLFLAACINSEGVEKVNKDASGLTLRGFDTVAYFDAESAVTGNRQYEFVWNGAKWLFSSAENLEKFRQNPEKYAPQFGGYCSYAVSHGYTADGDPQAWKVVQGKLYLNYNQEVKKLREQNQAQFIKAGEKNWAEFQKKKPEQKG